MLPTTCRSLVMSWVWVPALQDYHLKITDWGLVFSTVWSKSQWLVSKRKQMLEYVLRCSTEKLSLDFIFVVAASIDSQSDKSRMSVFVLSGFPHHRVYQDVGWKQFDQSNQTSSFVACCYGKTSLPDRKWQEGPSDEFVCVYEDYASCLGGALNCVPWECARCIQTSTCVLVSEPPWRRTAILWGFLLATWWVGNSCLVRFGSASASLVCLFYRKKEIYQPLRRGL